MGLGKKDLSEMFELNMIEVFVKWLGHGQK